MISKSTYRLLIMGNEMISNKELLNCLIDTENNLNEYKEHLYQLIKIEKIFPFNKIPSIQMLKKWTISRKNYCENLKFDVYNYLADKFGNKDYKNIFSEEVDVDLLFKLIPEYRLWEINQIVKGYIDKQELSDKVDKLISKYNIEKFKYQN